MTRNEEGWTLIELLVVMTLIGVLSSMALVQYRQSIQASKEAVLHSNLFLMRDAINQYYADKGMYPASIQALVTDGYVRRIPVDPITRSADTWTTTPADGDPNSPSATPGIYDIKSGADGTRFSDWH